jgi:hypothetical protein
MKTNNHEHQKFKKRGEKKLYKNWSEFTNAPKLKSQSPCGKISESMVHRYKKLKSLIVNRYKKVRPGNEASIPCSIE